MTHSVKYINPQETHDMICKQCQDDNPADNCGRYADDVVYCAGHDLASAFILFI